MNTKDSSITPDNTQYADSDPTRCWRPVSMLDSDPNVIVDLWSQPKWNTGRSMGPGRRYTNCVWAQPALGENEAWCYLSGWGQFIPVPDVTHFMLSPKAPIK